MQGRGPLFSIELVLVRGLALFTLKLTPVVVVKALPVKLLFLQISRASAFLRPRLEAEAFKLTPTSPTSPVQLFSLRPFFQALSIHRHFLLHRPYSKTPLFPMEKDPST